MGDLGQFVTLLIGVLAISGAAGAGFQRGKIGQLRGELTEANTRADRINAELTETRADLKDAEGVAKQLRTDLDALGRVVTGEAHWIAIGQQLDGHHAEATRHWTQQQTTLDRIAIALEGRRTG